MTNTPETAGTSTPAPEDKSAATSAPAMGAGTGETSAPPPAEPPPPVKSVVDAFHEKLGKAGAVHAKLSALDPLAQDGSAVAMRMEHQNEMTVVAIEVVEFVAANSDLKDKLSALLPPKPEPAPDPKPADPNKPVEPGYPDAETGAGTPPPAAETHDKPHGHGHDQHGRDHKKK